MNLFEKILKNKKIRSIPGKKIVIFSSENSPKFRTLTEYRLGLRL